MSSWDGAIVTSRLGVSFKKPSRADARNKVQLKDLVGMAVRRNPKRAHLLVSHVLGKHVPVDPATILAAGRLLGAGVSHVLRGVDKDSGEAWNLSRAMLLFKWHLSDGDNVDLVHEILDHNRMETPAAVTIGYAETATSLGMIVASEIGSYYIHSTRYADEGILPYGKFEEEHSHATSHDVTPLNRSYLDSSLPVVLVDDELTTGKTIINTITALNATAHHPHYIVTTLIDCRTDADKQRMAEFAADLGIKIDVVALATGVVKVPSDILDNAETVICSLDSAPKKEVEKKNAKVTTITANPLTKVARTGIHMSAQTLQDYTSYASDISDQLSHLKGSVLVLGTEEFMFLPVLTAEALTSKVDGPVYSSSTTRSPVVAYDNPGYAIRNSLTFNVEPTDSQDNGLRFAHNAQFGYDNIVVITDFKLDSSLRNGMINTMASSTDNLTIVQVPSVPLPEPLTSPAFGSYAPDDVKWLLKDLSDVDLEAPLEQREKAIQSGKAHYSESLPIEFQPSQEYQDLFISALHDNSLRLAQAVARVTDWVVSLRGQDVVLVSLARAGTPIGVLMKRWAKHAYGVDVAHYAVSIVRGKGIDKNALAYLAANHDPSKVMFVDGWTGKGAITKELAAALEEYAEETGVSFGKDIAVLADPGHSVRVYGTREDYLIPSACLNSTVSGLVSRTVVNKDVTGPHDFHGAKFYADFASVDVSNFFIDTVVSRFDEVVKDESPFVLEDPTWEGWRTVERINEEYGIGSINFVKPGVGETTRVLLRRVPWKILIRPDYFEELAHVRMLAEQRGVEIELVADLPYSCVGLIKTLPNAPVTDEAS